MSSLSDRFLGHERFELKLSFILVVLTLAAILIYPLGCVLLQSVGDADGALTGSNYSAVLNEPRFWKALGNSFTVSGISALIAAFLAFWCAWGLHFSRIHPTVKKFVQIIVLLPLFLPSITYGFAVIYSFGRLGLVSQIFGVLPFSIYGFWGLLISDVIYTLPPAFLILMNAFHYVDRNVITVSRLMGDSPLKTFYMSSLRPIAGALCAAFILSFFLSFTDFGIPVSIAGQYEVIATELYTTMMGAVPDFGRGAVIVDTHFARVAGRLGYTASTDPAKIEEDIRKEFDEDELFRLSMVLNLHGRKYCHARKPECDICPVRDYCKRE